jgi:hypothetical protein
VVALPHIESRHLSHNRSLPLSNAGGSIPPLHTYLAIGAGLYQRACGWLPTEKQVRAFAADCPPFFALMIAMAHAQFEWTIRKSGYEK